MNKGAGEVSKVAPASHGSGAAFYSKLEMLRFQVGQEYFLKPWLSV